MFVVHFLLLLVPLVFFHELGHFLVARWMGVRVLSFSIGFGPVVAQWQRNGTQYAVRALPLGGFVRMLGEDDVAGADEGEAPRRPGDPLPPDSFAAKAVWRRALIVAAGPAANFVLPVVVLFAGSLALDGQVVSHRVGTVLPGGPAAKAGLQTGDRVLEVDGEPVRHFRDLQRVISARPAKRVAVRIDRGGQEKVLSLTTDARVEAQLPELGIIKRVGRIQVLPDTQAAVVAVTPDSAAWRAGLRSGERVLAVGDTEVPGYWQMRAALDESRGATVALRVAPLSGEPEGPLHSEGRARTVQLEVPASGSEGLTPAQAVVGRVSPKSPAAEAGLRAGDELVEVQGQQVTSFFTLEDVLRKSYDAARGAEENLGLAGDELIARLDAAVKAPVAVKVRRVVDGAPQVVALSLRMRVTAREKSKRPRLRVGMWPAQRYARPERVANPERLGYALARTREEMTRAVKVTGLTVIGLFRGRVPMKEVGGPILMAQLATQAAEGGWGPFLQLMAWLSVNLAILNLLPIPMVDGGQLLFLSIEAVKREPVTLRTRMIASYAGLGFLFFVFVMVMKNDLQRLFISLAG